MNLIQIKQIDGLTSSLNSLSTSIYNLDLEVSESLDLYNTFFDQTEWDEDHIKIISEGSNVEGHAGVALGVVNANLYVGATGIFDGEVNLLNTEGQLQYIDFNGNPQRLKGAIEPRYTEISTADTTLAATAYIVGVDTSSIGAASKVTIPDASSVDAGKEILLKAEGMSASSFNITVTGAGSTTIDGQVVATITGDGGYMSVYSNGSNWHSHGDRLTDLFV